MNYRASQKILLVLCLLSIVCIVGYLLTQSMIMFYLCVGLFLVGFLQGYMFYRCPVCKKSLMRNGRAVPEKCPHCQSELK